MIAVAQFFQVGAEFGNLRSAKLYAYQYPAIGRTMIAVVKQTDVPAATQASQKIQQGSGAFGKDEAKKSLVLYLGRV